MKILKTIATAFTSYKTYVIASAVFAVLLTGAYHSGKWKGSNEQKVIHAEEEAKAITKGVQTHDKVNREVKKLSDTSLDTNLDKWMRD